MPHVGIAGRATANDGLRCESKDVMKLSRRRLVIIFLSALLLAWCTPSYSIDKTRYRELSQKLSEAAKQKDWQRARDVLTEIGRELPAPTPRYMLSVATIEARLGHKDEALRWIQKYVATGLSFDPSKDEDLKALMSAGTGEKVAALMKERSLPVTNAEFVCELPQADTMPEDITYLRGSGKLEAAFMFPAFSTTRSIECRCPGPEAGNARCKNCRCRLKPNAGPRWPSLPIQSARSCG